LPTRRKRRGGGEGARVSESSRGGNREGRRRIYGRSPSSIIRAAEKRRGGEGGKKPRERSHCSISQPIGKKEKAEEGDFSDLGHKGGGEREEKNTKRKPLFF